MRSKQDQRRADLSALIALLLTVASAVIGYVVCELYPDDVYTTVPIMILVTGALFALTIILAISAAATDLANEKEVLKD